MEDILITDIQGFEEITESVIIDKDVPVSVSDDNLRKEIIEGGEPINKSDVSILGSNDINNLFSIEDFNLEDYFYINNLFRSGNYNNFYGSDTIYIPSKYKFSQFDLVSFLFRENNSSENYYQLIIDPKECLEKNYSPSFSARYGSSYITRPFVLYDDCVFFTSTNIRATSSSNNNYLIPIEINGLYFKDISDSSQPDIPVSPSVSGNVVNNYYISLSGNGVSYNLIDKPLNEYTPTESMFALSILFALGIGFVILCRKAVFRWK